MADIKTLREKVANIVTESRSKLDLITDETPVERAKEIETEVDAMLADVAGLEAKIEREEKLQAVAKRAEEAAETEERAKIEAKRPGGKGSAAGVDDGEVPTYRQAFHQWMVSNFPNQGPISNEARAVLQAGYSDFEVAPENRAQTAGTNSAGGFTVPEEMRPELIRSMLMWGPMYDPGVTFELVMSGGNPMPFPTVDDTANTAAANTEGATLTDDGGSDVTFGEKQLDAYAFDTEWVRLSLPLIQDSALAMESVLTSLLSERLGRTANAQLTTGSGSSAPHGIVTASTAGKTAASATAITYDEIMDLEHSVDPAYRTSPRCGFMMNDSTLLAIRKLKDGDGNYLWQMGNVQSGIPNMINGRPYFINQAMASIATGQRTILFGDMNKYWVRKISGMPIVGAIQDKDFWPGIGVAGYIRFDGELTDTAAVKHLIQA